MTFDDLIGEICSRVNDPDRDTYATRAENLFYAGIPSLISAGGWTVEDIPYLYRTRTMDTALAGGEIGSVYEDNELLISGDSNELTAIYWLAEDAEVIAGDETAGTVRSVKNVLKIIDIVDGTPDDTNAGLLSPSIKYRRITHDDYSQLSIDSEYLPQSQEIFYLIDLKGTDTQIIKFIPASDGTMSGKEYKVSYIIAPKESEFGTTTELSDRFSDSFIWKVIDFAEAKLKQEITGE